MIKSLSLASILLLSVLMVAGQDVYPDRVPKQYTVEAGYNYILNSDFQHTAGNGISVGFDYAWQLTGLTGKKPPVYISVPLGYNYFFSSHPGDTAMSMLIYGWTVRHHLKKKRQFSPYLGYCLLINQLKISGKEGSVLGHQTRFVIGSDLSTNKPITFLQLEYSMIRFPSFGPEKSSWIHSMGIKSGIKF